VLLGKFPDRAALLRRQEELRSQQFEVEEIAEAAGQPQALSLGRFDDPGAAEAALAQLRQRGLRGATVVMQSPPQTQYWLRVAQADGATRASLAQLPQAAPLGAFAPCAKAH
jgi:hypothetical protein